VGRHGSGTIFFAYCNLHCVFCQNYSISQLGEGGAVDGVELAVMMLSLQAKGCHNINLVSPTHLVPFILGALEIATGRGLQLPIVYNTGGYDSVATLELLDGVVDIYMPDMKYSEKKVGEELSGVRDYPRVNQTAVKEMYRQVGDLMVDASGVAVRGLLVRHLVLPHGLAGTESVVKFLAEEISTDTYLNIMAQYHPCYHASEHPGLSRPITDEEYAAALELARRYGLHRLDERVSPPSRIIGW
jgi:putative pyruvate formate lyase activating enzyme